MAKKKGVSRAKYVILAIAIAIIFAMFVGYGISTFYHSPDYSDYCSDDYYEVYPRIAGKPVNFTCPEIEENATFMKDCRKEGGYPHYDIDENGCQINPRCEMCGVEYENVQEKYDRVVFIITLIIGLIALVVGIVLKHDSVSPGIMGGGALTIFYGTLRYWGHAPDVLRFVILGVVLAVLIWVGYKKFTAK